jgi:predicted GIY-YIG superfamily endonuclease
MSDQPGTQVSGYDRSRAMLLRDRLRARLAEMGDAPDHQRLADEVLGIRNAPADLARRLVSQALVIEERQDVWQRIGERVCAAAPASPGVYILRDERGSALYVGKATNLRRRLRAHFARRRWPALKAGMARVVDAEWETVGSELEALLREVTLIAALAPAVNVQIGPPALETRDLPRALLRDLIVVVPSVEEHSAELVAVRADGPWMIQRTRRDGADLVADTSRLMRFFHSPLGRDRVRRSSPASVPPSARSRRPASAIPADDGKSGDGIDAAPIVFSWLARRGADTTRLDPHDAPTRRDLAARLAGLLRDERLFTERIDQRGSATRAIGSPRASKRGKPV